MNNIRAAAERNLLVLEHLPAGACLIVAGMNVENDLVQVVAITGDDPESRGAEQDQNDGCVFVRSADSNRAFNMMRHFAHDDTVFVVGGNGPHVDDIVDGYGQDRSMGCSMEAVVHQRRNVLNTLPLVAASSWWHKDRPIINLHSLWPFGDGYIPGSWKINEGVSRGLGQGLTTQTHLNGSSAVLHSYPFYGEDAVSIATGIWKALPRATRISVAVKIVPRNKPPLTHVINT